MTSSDEHAARRGRIDGAILIGTACLSVLAMMHHPQVVAHNAHDALHQITEKSAADNIVHGALTLLLGIQSVAYFGIANRLGWARFLTQCGGVAYFAGLLFIFQVALTDGFVIPEVTRAQSGVPGSDEATITIFNLCASNIRIYTAAGLVLMSAGFASWAAILLGASRRKLVLGIIGLAVNSSIVLAVLFGILHLDLHGALTLIILQSFWNVAAGIGSWRGVF